MALTTFWTCTTGLSANQATDGTVDRKSVIGVFPNGDEKELFLRCYDVSAAMGLIT